MKKRDIPTKVAADFKVGQKVVVWGDLVAEIKRIEKRKVKTVEDEVTYSPRKIGEEYNPLLWLAPIFTLDGEPLEECFALNIYTIRNQSIDLVSFDASHCELLNKDYFNRQYTFLQEEIERNKELERTLINPETGEPI